MCLSTVHIRRHIFLYIIGYLSKSIKNDTYACIYPWIYKIWCICRCLNSDILIHGMKYREATIELVYRISTIA